MVETGKKNELPRLNKENHKEEIEKNKGKVRRKMNYESKIKKKKGKEIEKNK